MIFDDPYDSSLILADRTVLDRPFVCIDDLSKHFAGSDQPVFRDAFLTLRRGETLCLIGHSGCGKSTMLRLVAGLDNPSGGKVTIDGRAVLGPNPDRPLMTGQHGLLPWLTILENIAFAVRARWPGWAPAKIVAHAQHHAELTGLRGLEGKKPGQVSAPVKLRVALARALAAEPKLLLLDEPFAALDTPMRGRLLDEVRRHAIEYRQTVLMATHDIDEALYLADRIALINNGPDARIVEIVRNTLPRERTRRDLHFDPHYYGLRDHLIEFLIVRSRQYRRIGANLGSARRPMLPPPAAHTPPGGS